MTDKIIKHRIDYIDIFRGMAIVFMITGHIGGQAYIDRYIHMFHMPVWFFISGFFYRDKGESFGKVIKKKGKALLAPYFIWGILQYPVWILLESNGENILEPLRNLFWINTNLVMPIAGALWFLTCLFFAELIFLILKRTISNNCILCIIIIIITIVGNEFTNMFSFRLPWAIDASFVAIGLLYIGNIFNKYNQNKCISYIFNLPKGIWLCLFAINGILCFVNGYINMRIGMYGIIPLFWLNAITAIVIYWNLSKYLCEISLKWVNNCNGILKRIGKNSIVYLCLNQLVILLFDLLLKNIGLGNLNWFLRGIIILLGTLIILYLTDMVTMDTRMKVVFGK